MDSLVLLAASLVEGYLLQHSLLPDWAFRSVTLLALAGNLILRFVWGFIIYPYWVNPLRHLPTLPVYFVLYLLIAITVTKSSRATSTMRASSSTTPAVVSHCNG